MYRHIFAASNADRFTSNRQFNACAHTAADGYSHPGPAYGHEHAVADGDGHSRAAHSNAHSDPADGNQDSQAHLATTASAHENADGGSHVGAPVALCQFHYQLACHQCLRQRGADHV